jgi:hypothetical protein
MAAEWFRQECSMNSIAFQKGDAGFEGHAGTNNSFVTSQQLRHKWEQTLYAERVRALSPKHDQPSKPVETEVFGLSGIGSSHAVSNPVNVDLIASKSFGLNCANQLSVSEQVEVVPVRYQRFCDENAANINNLTVLLRDSLGHARDIGGLKAQSEEVSSQGRASDLTKHAVFQEAKDSSTQGEQISVHITDQAQGMSVWLRIAEMAPGRKIIEDLLGALKLSEWAKDTEVFLNGRLYARYK